MNLFFFKSECERTGPRPASGPVLLMGSLAARRVTPARGRSLACRLRGHAPDSRINTRGPAGSVAPAMTTPIPLPEPSPDLEFGAFSEHGPWVLDLDAIPWRWDVDRIRRGTRVEVPEPPRAGSDSRRSAA